MDSLIPLRPPRLSQDGLSLIEVVVSVVLLSLVGIGFALSLGLGQGEIVDEGYRRMALTLAEEQIERLKALNYNDAALSAGAYPVTVLHQDTVTLDDRGTVSTTDDLTGTRSWRVSEMNGVGSYKWVALTLSWTTGGQTHSVALDTYIAQ
ncbi:MAG: hypothetical protein HYY20_01820 [Candidatus Tectomicrobia bacterium]|uniref:Prepilin-type N-terminal cleavage/methylation domain-containing protein n=1 Tax=Tectimicrobiota bacterium TaxID=2528274 RepID=A0A932CLH1_UNCTE|nr:hypothetical protein [Candidatus Tectomicrobia bacterium]